MSYRGSSDDAVKSKMSNEAAMVMLKSYWLEVRPRSTSDEFLSRVIIRNQKLSAIVIWRTIPVTPFAIYQHLASGRGSSFHGSPDRNKQSLSQVT